MTGLSILHEYGEELERRLRLQTYPLALKLLKREADIPEGAQRPLRDFGYHMDLCQAFSLSRKEGETVAELKEDMWCSEPVIGYGLVEPPSFFMEGYNRVPEDVKDLTAGKNYAADLPKLEVGKYIGVVTAPLTTVNFKPDVVIIYANPAQLSLLLLGREYEQGHDLMCHLSSHAACVYSTVPVVTNQQCQVALPCRGDRYRAGAADNEMIFSTPTAKLESLMTGLRHVEKSGSKFPRNIQMRIEPEQRETYTKLAKMIGVIKE